MKTKSINSFIWTALFLGSIFLSVSSCKKDNNTKPQTLKEGIVGTWNITSFKVGGTEYMGSVVKFSSLKYEAFTGTQGNFTQAVTYVDNSNESTNGKYSVDEVSKEVKMTTVDEEIIAKINLKDDILEFSGEQDGEELLVKATRK